MCALQPPAMQKAVDVSIKAEPWEVYRSDILGVTQPVGEKSLMSQYRLLVLGVKGSFSDKLSNEFIYDDR